MPQNLQSEVGMSVDNEHAPRDTSSQNEIIEPFESVASASTILSIGVQAEETDPSTIESNAVFSETSYNSVSGHAIYSIPGDDTMFTPQTPTHTPIQRTETGDGAGTPNEEVPHLDLDAATEDLNRIGQGPRGELYIVPGDDNYVLPGHGRGDPSIGVYRIGQTVVLEPYDPDPRQRIRLALPNPRDLATIEVVMTVPYELGRDPVGLTVALPPRNSPFERENHRVLQFEVLQESDYDGVDERSAAPHTPLDGEATIENSKAVRFVKQLPRLDLVDMPELQDHPCCICREPYVLGGHPVLEQGEEYETLVRLSCNHVFGERCLTRWLHTYRGSSDIFNTQCPLCRQELSIDQAGVIFRLPEGVRREPDGVSPVEYDRASYDQIVLGNQRFGSGWLEVLGNAELAAELMLPDCRCQKPGNENVRSLFEALQLKGAFRSPCITEEYRAYGNRSDVDVYDGLKAEGAHWTTRWGMLSLYLLTVLLGRWSRVSKLLVAKMLTPT